jgi:hypothetical protein
VDVLPGLSRQERDELLDERLQRLMQELGNAINESLSDSDRIAEAISEIRKEGYDVFLVLEATIGFNKREDVEETNLDEETTPTVKLESTTDASFTTQDEKFLRSLKITIDEE